MSANDPDDGHEQVHRGYELETGLLARAREWTDILPWLRLGRTLRVAGSPPLVFVTAITYLLWWCVDTQLLGGCLNLSLYDKGMTALASWWLWAGVAWWLIVWAPVALLLTRQGALLTAGRTMVGMHGGLAHAIGRAPSAWVATVVPFACVAAIGFLIVCVGWLARLLGGITLLEAMLALVVVAIAVPCGILSFGAVVAVPLSWAALANERDPDPLDSLSRGYESLYRRPLRLLLYLILSVGIMIAVGLLAAGVALASAGTASVMLHWSGCGTIVASVAQQVLSHFPAVVVMTQWWSLVGGVYLLLRYDTGGQDVEDLWQPSPPPSPPLPEIPSQ